MNETKPQANQNPASTPALWAIDRVTKERASARDALFRHYNKFKPNVSNLRATNFAASDIISRIVVLILINDNICAIYNLFMAYFSFVCWTFSLRRIRCL